MSNVIYGSKALGGRMQQWQGPGTPALNHVGSYFTGGHGAEPARVRAAVKELRGLYRRLDLNTPQTDVEHLSKVIRDLEALLPRDNPTKAGGMTAAEARKAIPKSQIDFLVGKYHVRTSPDVVAEDIMSKGRKCGWPEAGVKAAGAYARERHAKNLEMYNDVTSGRIGVPRKKARG